jgi:hypothetical protein
MSKYEVPTEQNKAARLVRYAERPIGAGPGYLTRTEVCEFLRSSCIRLHTLVTERKFRTSLKQGDRRFSTVAWPAPEIRGWEEAQRKEGQHARA